MSFVTVTFAVFLTAVFLLHWAVAGAHWQRAVLLAASFCFYGWWDWRFCGLLGVSAVTGFGVGYGLGAVRGVRGRRALLMVSVAVELGILGFFKYFNFFADSFALAMAVVGVDVSTTTLNVVLPVGISFYTFQSLSYVVDVYRGGEPERRFTVYLLYLAFFPQLVAGPIERAGNLLAQLGGLRRFDARLATVGCRLALWGVAKKLLFADPLGVVADGVFAGAAVAGPVELMVGTLAFAFQIYGDFSGYSDIAAGVGLMFGVRLSRNFAYPYFAASLTEFWRRWHVTLSNWLRDYVYIPLGGSRGTAGRTCWNLLVTLLLSGLWHGAAWHYVAWGGWHALGLMVERLLGRLGGAGSGVMARVGRAGGVAVTFLFVMAGWVLFRARDLGEAWGMLGRMVGGWGGVGWADFAGHGKVAGLVGVWLVVEWLGRRRWDPIAWERAGAVWRWGGYTALVWLILVFGSGRVGEFIYFQF